MRSRYLTTNYFSSSQSQTLKNLHLFPLPPPPPSLSSPNPHLDTDLDLLFSDLDLSSELDRLPFAAALSDFLSHVLPQFVEIQEPDLAGSESEACDINEFVYEEEFRSEAKGSSKLEEWRVEFEVVEVEEFPLGEDGSSCKGEGEGICFEVPRNWIPVEAVEIDMGLTVIYPHEIVKSVCAVESIPDCLSVNEDRLCPAKLSNRVVKISEFEVTEVGLGLEGALSIGETLSCLLPLVEPRHAVYNEKLEVNGNEFLGSSSIDILELISKQPLPEQCPMEEPIPLNSVLEMNVINLNGSLFLEKDSAIYPMTSDGNCSRTPCSGNFQEVQTLDIPPVQNELFAGSTEAEELNLSDQMFKDDMNSVGRMYKSFVSSELTLVDDTFKSLPIPILSDNKHLKLPSMIFEDTLHVLKLHAFTAADGLYLDWHLLLEGTCTREICSTYMCMLLEVSSCTVTSPMQSIDEVMIHINLDFVDDSPKKSKVSECKVLDDLDRNFPHANVISAKPVVTLISKDDVGTVQTEKHNPKINSQKASSLFESMSQSNDLNFFLGVRKGTAGKISTSETMKGGSSTVTPAVESQNEPSHPPVCLEIQLKHCDIKVHDIILSDHILGLMDNVQKSYLAILNYGTDLRSHASFTPEYDLEFLSLPKEKLLELITEKSKCQLTSDFRDETFTGLLALYAIKQLAYFLCFFGIHTALLYVRNLTKNIGSLVIKLRPLELLLEDAQKKTERRIIDSHPSLSIIEGILKSNTSQNGKILIVAERLFWLPLNQKLISMRIKLHEVRRSFKLVGQLDTLNGSGFINYISETLLHSDCLLISHENISDSLPFNMFSIILEYGGPCASSRISSISSTSYGFPRVHFLKLCMENHGLVKALCEGFDEPHHISMDRVSQSVTNMQGILNKNHVEELLSFVPIENNNCLSSGSEVHVDASHDNRSSMSISHSLNSKNISANIPSSPDVVVVVNTQNLEKEMFISRRSSYQKVLALEKEGVQVVERDINLPLDLIFSADVCLVWYETSSLGDNSITTSSIPLFMETIATTVLMTLSFAFSGCILIFEGESKYLSAIMESSDTLYAAAASLDLNLQLFWSYMQESTDEIILSCIGSSIKLNKGIFPAMPESETLGESFLTRFPSINTLSAHAILSSGGMLIEFLEWSLKRRIQAIGKYHVPDESIHLFNVLCRFGEMGESKSVMTECSSIGSEISSIKFDERKRHRAISPQNLEMPSDHSVFVKPLKQINEKFPNFPHFPHGINQSGNFFNFQDSEHTKSSQLFTTDESLAKKQKSHTSRGTILHNDDTFGCRLTKESFREEVTNHNHTYVNGTDEAFEKKQGSYSSNMRNPDSNKTSNHGYLREIFSDEVNDHNSTFRDENLTSIPSITRFFGEAEPTNKPVGNSSLHDGRLAFNPSSYRTFPTSEEINSDIDGWKSVVEKSQNSDEKIISQGDSYSRKNDFPMKHQKVNLKWMPKSIRNALGSQKQEKVALCVETLHQNEIMSSRMPEDPIRISEFLQRVKDKREVHPRTLECNTCLNCPGTSRNEGKSYKRQSPSITDSYKYQGSRKIPANFRKWRRGGRVQGNSINEEKKESSFIIPSSWTPVDKRARQNLTFSRTGNEKQRKLVWRNRCSPGSSFNLRKRTRDTI